MKTNFKFEFKVPERAGVVQGIPDQIATIFEKQVMQAWEFALAFIGPAFQPDPFHAQAMDQKEIAREAKKIEAEMPSLEESRKRWPERCAEMTARIAQLEAQVEEYKALVKKAAKLLEEK